jgi:DNA-binding CsgD family transcriptional regulator
MTAKTPDTYHIPDSATAKIVPNGAVVLGWMLDGYSDGQISRREKLSLYAVAEMRAAFRSGGLL